jgi:hypothetical protein
MIDIVRLSEWGAAVSELQYGDARPLGIFVKKWGVESELEKCIVGDALLGQHPEKKRANAFNRKTFEAAYKIAKTHQRLMNSNGRVFLESDVIDHLAAWLHKTPESINTLLHRHGIKN